MPDIALAQGQLLSGRYRTEPPLRDRQPNAKARIGVHGPHRLEQLAWLC